jgi:hypothetical protein
MTKRAIGEDRSIYLGLSSETHRALRHICAERDCSIPKLIKTLINDLIATYWPQQPVVDDFSGLIPTEMEMPNGAEMQGDLIERQGAESGG